MSSDWSFGSRSHPCSQSRKISIGIMVDSLTKKGSECARKYETEATALRKVNSKLGKGADTVEGKRTKLQQEEGSPWVLPRSDCKNSLISEGDSKLKGDKRSKDKTSSKLDKLKTPPPDKTIKVFSHNASFLASKGTGGKRPDGQKKNGEVNQNTDATGKSFSTLEQGVFTADKVPARDKVGCTGNKQSEKLRMKLCELMGSVLSPEKGQIGSPAMDVGVTSLQPGPNINQATDVKLQPKPNSDTIETVSENPGRSKRRPVSRSITRKRAQKKTPLRKIERGHRSTRKDELKESNVYLFGEDCKVTESYARKKSSSTFKQKKRIPKTTPKSKKTWRKFTWDEPRGISFPFEENEDKVQEEAGRKESSAGRSSARGVRPQNSSSLTPHRLGKNGRPGAVVTEKDPLEQLLERNLDGGKDINITKLTENVVRGKHTGNTSALKKSAEQQHYFVSPTLGRRTPLTSSSPDSSCKDDRTRQDNPSVAEAMFNLERMFTFGNFTSKDIHTKPREQPYLGNDDSDSPDSAASDSDSSEGGDLDSSEKDPGEEEALSPEVVTVKNSTSKLHRPKRPRSLRDVKSYDHQPVSHSSKGKGIKTTARKQDSGEFQVQDEFSRAIGPLAMSLEKIKGKMKSVTAKKSSEILNSLAAKIQAQMQNMESQVQSDVGKVKNFSKQKRKFLERAFHGNTVKLSQLNLLLSIEIPTNLEVERLRSITAEQEKQLKSIHERFKKELGQHVQHCIETTEGLEENEIELKKILEKQKVSHRKLLKQVEQSAQTEIQDAEKRISNMNKLAREQMLHLRLSIEQSLGEDVLC